MSLLVSWSAVAVKAEITAEEKADGENGKATSTVGDHVQQDDRGTTAEVPKGPQNSNCN